MSVPNHDRSWRLSRSARKLTLLTHVVVSVGWVGVDAALLVLAVTGLTSDNPQTVAACYTSMKTFAVVLLLPLGLAALATGLLLGAGGRWGILRHWWVVTKLVINLVLTSLVLALLRPRLDDAAEASLRVDGSLVHRLGSLRLDLVFPPTVSIVALVFAATLGLYKPWSMTARGRRLDRRGRRRSVA